MRLKSAPVRLIGWFVHAQLVVAMFVLAAMMLLVVADVAMRYLMNAPIRGAYEAVEIGLSTSVFFAIGTVLLRGQEIVIDLIDEFVSPGVRRLLISAAAVGSAIALAYVFYSMLSPAREAFEYGDRKLDLDLPVWIVWALDLVGLAGGIAASVAVLFSVPERVAGHEQDLGRAE